MLLQTSYSTSSSKSAYKGDDAQKVLPLWTSATAIFLMVAALALSDHKVQLHSISHAKSFKILELFSEGGMVDHIYIGPSFKNPNQLN